jgi:hypothetical protein
VLSDRFLYPNTSNGEEGSAKDPASQHCHSGNGIASDDAQDQAEGNCLDGDAKHGLSFFDMKQAAYARVSVIALEKAKNNTGIDK